MQISKKITAELALVLVTLIWGLTFPITRIVISEMSSFSLIFFRSILATIVIVPFIFLNNEDRKSCLKLLPFGFLLGLIVYLSILFQTFGLETINSARSAFLTNLTIIFVPLLSPLFQKTSPTKKDLISIMIALIGMLIMTDPFRNKGLSVGDLWTILCAFTFSIHIHLIQLFVIKFNKSKVFSFLEVFFMSIFALTFLPVSGVNLFPKSFNVYLALFYLGAISTVGTTMLQAHFQCKTTPERASIIYILEPIFAMFFGFVILNESMSFKSLIGGLLVIFSVVWIYLFHFGKNLRKTV